MNDNADDAFGRLRGAIEDIEELGQRLHTRMLSDDIPWGAGSDISAEFSDDFDNIAAEIRKAHDTLINTIP